jgi:hypothetical protein
MARTSPRHTLVALALVAGCTAAPSPSESSTPQSGSPTRAASAAPSATDGAELTGGPLAAGVRYLLPGFEGLSIRMAADGWTGSFLNGGDIVFASPTTVAFLTAPTSIISSDGTIRRDWPTDDPGRATASIEAVRGVTIESVEAITVAGIETELLTVDAQGQNAEAPMFQSASGDFGLTDGRSGLVLLPIGDRLFLVVLELQDNDSALDVLDGLTFD